MFLMAHNVDYILLHTLAIAMNNVIAQCYICILLVIVLHPKSSHGRLHGDTKKEHAKIGTTSKIAWVPHTRSGRAFKVGAHAVNPVTNANTPTL